MLSDKPWKADAVLRLGASIVVCMFLGMLAGAVVRFLGAPRKAEAALLSVAVAGACGLYGGALFFLRGPWPFEKFTRYFMALVVCVYGGLMLNWWALHLLGETGAAESSTVTLVIGVFSFQGVALVLVHRFLREHATGWRQGFGLNHRPARAIGSGVLAAFALFLVCQVLQRVSADAMAHFHIRSEEQSAVQIARDAGGWAERLVLMVATIFIVPPTEEILFRGILYPAIKLRGFPRTALWGTAIGFAAIHQNLTIFLPLIVLALVLTWLYEKTENLLAPITAHAVFNAIGFAALTVQTLGKGG